MIKLKSILNENQILITEKFAAGKLRALTNHWQGLEAQFFMWVPWFTRDLLKLRIGGDKGYKALKKILASHRLH